LPAVLSAAVVRKYERPLEERFAPPNQTELYRVQLTERRKKPAESLPELGQAIRRLVNLAYPTVPENVRDTLAKQNCFVYYLDHDQSFVYTHVHDHNSVRELDHVHN
jgi:hypothetical protein